MSTTKMGGASLRLVTGFAATALVISGVIAANLHSRPQAPSCTATGRNAANVVPGDVVKIACTNLNNGDRYRILTPSASLTGWKTSDRSGSATGTTPGSGLGFKSTDTDGSNTYAKSSAGTYTFVANNATETRYLWVDSGSLSSLNVKDIDTGENSAISTLPSVNTLTMGFGSPDNVMGVATLNLVIGGLPSSETYRFMPTASSNADGWDNAAVSGTGSSGSGFTFGAGLGATNTYTASGSDTVYFKTMVRGSTNSAAKLALLDSDGNIILAQPNVSSLTATIAQ